MNQPRLPLIGPTIPILLTLAFGFLAAGPAAANEFAPQLEALARGEIADWAKDPVILDAIRKQNEVTHGYSADQIDALDQSWRAEVGADARPTIEPVIQNAASAFLRRKRDGSDGLFTEIFVMDARGLNVAASDVTSDYWQRDEAKWQKTYEAGPGAVEVGEIEHDESTQTYQSQVSVAIVDPGSGAAIGALTVGVNVELLN